MMTGYRGTFVISWSQTELDGLAAPPDDALVVGAAWRWAGEAVRVDGPGNVLVLGPAEEVTQLRTRAARSVRRLVGAAVGPEGAERLPDAAAPVLDTGFAVTDGIDIYTATLIDLPQQGTRLLMFIDVVPPKGRDLWVSHVQEGRCRMHRFGDGPPGVICFTPDTRIATPLGPRPAGELEEGDSVLTKDDGPQRIVWIGRRRMSGAMLHALPDLRPIRVRAGAVGLDIPDTDLLLSPEHRLLVKGAMASELFNAPEVLVKARDLINDHTIMVDHLLHEVSYVHLLLERHQIVFANGIEAESFHPGSMPLDVVDPGQREALFARVPDLAEDPDRYGGYARRLLNRAEAAIFAHAVAQAH